MILTVVRISLLRLWHNKAELLLTFVVPLIFFSIFAWIFGSRDSDGGTPRIKVAVVDLVQDDQSREIIKSLRAARSLRFFGKATREDKQLSLATSETAEQWVRRGLVTAAIVLNKNEAIAELDKLEANNNSVAPKLENNVSAEILADSFDQVATQILGALVQKAVLSSQQTVIEKATAEARRVAVRAAQYDSAQFDRDSTIATAKANASAVTLASATSLVPVMKLPEVPIRDVLGENKVNPVIAMYAAGIAVMFSLFSATTVSGSLLEERENSTLERLLCSQLSIDQLLMGKWLYLTCLGFLQITLMFVWGWLAFGVDLFSHLPGFIVITVVTSAAAASFALMLATLCKTRMQLGWISTIVILVMSALGGSMVPRYLMSESVQKVGMLTFNAWALEGYSKIFWRDLRLSDINLELTVLVSAAFVMMIAARIFAIRWDRT